MSVKTDAYVVFGNPIAHSKSPLIHGLFAHQTKQAMSYQTYLAPLDQFAVSVQGFMQLGGCGANVTVPFKLEAFDLAQTLSERAQVAGAVNTLLFRDGQIIGDNTDGAGLVRDITVNLRRSLQGARVLLLGAGGAARGALLPLLQQLPAQLCIANRSVEKAETLCALAASFEIDDVQLSVLSLDALAQGGVGQFDVIINATSASLQQESVMIASDVFASDCLAYDMMYGDVATPFMRMAQSAGAQTADGLGMLVEQAAEAFYLWRGVRPDTALVLAQLRGDRQA
ncbi:MAG: shikimate dehydrogenase [Burkholderiales bacterium]|nr:shikimate dehydrogenase [Burkholderiales bacterium]